MHKNSQTSVGMPSKSVFPQKSSLFLVFLEGKKANQRIETVSNVKIPESPDMYKKPPNFKLWAYINFSFVPLNFTKAIRSVTET